MKRRLRSSFSTVLAQNLDRRLVGGYIHRRLPKFIHRVDLSLIGQDDFDGFHMPAFSGEVEQSPLMDKPMIHHSRVLLRGRFYGGRITTLCCLS